MPDTVNSIDVLHVASFVGNIGDNANHNGMRSVLSQSLDAELLYESREMRKYYQNYNKCDGKYFDQEFVDTANKKDLVIIGGGSFFDPWIADSATGTTIDITNSQINDIQTPIVFNGLGCVPNQNTTESIVEKFGSFLDHALSADHCLVSVRNDGSRAHIRDMLGESYANRINVIPDGGFFVDINNFRHVELPDSGTVVGVNVVADMPDRRFPGGRAHRTYSEYITEFSRFANNILENNPSYNLLFIPHIYKDFTAISDVLEQMDVMHRRNRITTAPYIHGMGKEKYIFSLYDSVDVSTGLRFHANACPIGLKTPTIGLANGHPKVSDLYQGLEMSNRCIPVHEGSFADELESLIVESVRNNESISRQYAERVESMRKDLIQFHKDIKALL